MEKISSYNMNDLENLEIAIYGDKKVNGEPAGVKITYICFME